MNRKWWVPAALAAVALSLTACYGGNLGGPRTAVVGDSITSLAAGDIGSAIGPDYAYETVATPNYTIAQGEGELQTVMEEPAGSPVDAIINLGTNDAMDQNSNWRADWDTLVNELQPVPCVIFVTVNTVVDWARLVPIASQINDEITQLVAGDPRFHEIDWATYVGTHFEDLSADGVHPSAAGDAELASLYASALHQDCGN